MSAAGRPSLRLVIAVALCATLGLTACGRRGALDPPPGGSAAAQPGADDDDQNSQGAAAAQGQKKRIPLDVLLN